jgi:hypothetical protein
LYSYNDTGVTIPSNDPGNGNFSLNGPFLTASIITLSRTDYLTRDVSGWLATWNASTNIVKGTLHFVRRADDKVFSYFNVNDVSGYANHFAIFVTNIANAGTHTYDLYEVSFVRTGDSGYSGRSGYSAYSGYSGFSGYSGYSGFRVTQDIQVTVVIPATVDTVALVVIQDTVDTADLADTRPLVDILAIVPILVTVHILVTVASAVIVDLVATLASVVIQVLAKAVIADSVVTVVCLVQA